MAYTRSLPRTRHWPRLAGLVSFVLAAIEARRQRNELAQLDDYQLYDIGMTPEEARAEIARDFWDVPSTWRKSCPPFGRKTR